jgi:hypothetical protein
MRFLFEDRYISGGNLRGEVTEIEWNKFKKASSIEMKILRVWVNQILVAEQLTPDILCEEDVHETGDARERYAPNIDRCILT